MRTIERLSARRYGATLAIAASAIGLSTSVAHGQQSSTPIACGFLLRQGQHLTDQHAADSVRRISEPLDRLVMIQRGQPGMAGARVRLERPRGWIGVQMTEVSETRTTSDGRLVRYCDYPVVVSVEPASPAERAGLESGDTVWAYNGVDLRRTGEVALDRLLIPDDTLRLGIRRNGRNLVLPLVVARRPDGPGMQAWAAPSTATYSYVLVTRGGRAPGAPPAATQPALAPSAPPAPGSPRAALEEAARVRAVAARRSAESPGAVTAPLPPAAPLLFSFGYGGSALAGAQLVAMDDDLRAAVGAKAGVLVLKVADGTPASEAGLRAGDVIVAANGRAVIVPAALQQLFLREADARALQLRVERRGKGRDVVLRW